VGVRHQCGVFFSSSFYARDFRLGEFGWRSASCYPSFHYIPLPPPSSGSSYILRSPSVITYYLSHIIETGWDKAHTGTDALVSFFINLDSHPAHSLDDTPEGKQALVWHQAHARVDWHRKLADFKKKAKDLSIHNNVTQAHWHALHLYIPCTAFTCTLALHAWHLLALSCTMHSTFPHPHAQRAAPTRTAFTCTLALQQGTFSHRCVPHTALSCTRTHHVLHPPALHLLAPLRYTCGTFSRN
jgi:hypothetical protein